MQIIARPPSPALAPFVESVWRFRGRFAHAYERVLPKGTMQLLVNLHEDQLRAYRGEGYATVCRTRGAILCGVHAKHVAIDTEQQRDIVGINFRPGGAFPFFPATAATMREMFVELDALWGRDGALLRERLLEAGDTGAILRTLESALLERASAPLKLDPAVAFAVASFDRGVGVSQVTEQLAMTPTRFIRRFSTIVGLTPKRFARVLRFQRVLDAASRKQRIDWVRVAVDCGYFDQAHLIHEFREFSGMKPTAYRPRSHTDPTHVPLAEGEIFTIPGTARAPR
ncbi:DUF6597 domain-containing transcriptional factor [Pendulispora albinea]|uniref:AraC family transcriptional regulator n=1 Tax=Pendulispora albinea TaxID=2741071 RepID=A0ABZ2LZ82_9BACT